MEAEDDSENARGSGTLTAVGVGGTDGMYFRGSAHHLLVAVSLSYRLVGFAFPGPAACHYHHSCIDTPTKSFTTITALAPVARSRGFTLGQDLLWSIMHPPSSLYDVESEEETAVYYNTVYPIRRRALPCYVARVSRYILRLIMTDVKQHPLTPCTGV